MEEYRMSSLLDIQKQLLETTAIMAEVERTIATHPDDNGVFLTAKSIQARHKELETAFKHEASRQEKDVIDYRLFSDDRMKMLSMTSVLDNFQRLFSIVFDAMANGAKSTAKIKTEVIGKTSLGFGYTYFGSIGVALTLPNTSELFETQIDNAMKETFGLMSIKSKEDIKSSIRRLGAGTISVFNDWVDSHVRDNIDAEIKWAKSTVKEITKPIQIPNLKYIKTLLEDTPIEESEILEFESTLVGCDTNKKIFHISTDEQDIAGNMDENIIKKITDNKITLPAIYTFRLLKKTITSRSKVQTKYILVGFQ
jgi:hypothetical protein